MKPGAVVKILLVEDDELFRLGLRMRLQQETGIEIVAEAEDGEQAVELANRYLLDLVLLDVGLPGIGGIEACRQIKQQHPDLPILVLTSRSEKPLIARLIEAGAQGYCLKGIPPESLILALRSVAAGASWWDQTATTEIRAAFGANNTAAPIQNKQPADNPLTKREQEILALVAAGKSNQEIAEILYIASGTVRVHVHAILHKLEVRDRTQAAILAIQKGLVAKELLRNS
ncbi:MAG: response regulator [Brasilonema octagenarum HA4186-MV1]|jgi:two-component system NarL family response regulator|uniref:DNA-binding response regulator n=2 Tax=Brasilonema TaxID=383614 RepID=A0A856MC39_9CYAN|nr:MULTISPECIES: response regulator transcription factor [Brasilonema]MBW4625522.1 response regulator [Brasilonema octagenarum HA4186-MV1]NMF61836.1 DNA-binding response regulator [Brasilonema octagenarum UFV-OR1]QDL08252.1 DNA-binding response regulator [Brasilonema sennae CENA114]QDL14608.1 DNA-binding response regulator [Brasilonema octagenarum UFV-E1]